jgi:hypothetical protein
VYFLDLEIGMSVGVRVSRDRSNNRLIRIVIHIR